MADPQHRARILVQAGDEAVFQFWRVTGIVNGVAHSVEPDEAVVSAQPQIAVASLQNPCYGTLLPAIFHSPHIEHLGSRLANREVGLCVPLTEKQANPDEDAKGGTTFPASRPTQPRVTRQHRDGKCREKSFRLWRLHRGWLAFRSRGRTDQPDRKS